MSDEEATKITIHPPTDEALISIIFCWLPVPYAMLRERGLAVTSRDGRVTMTLSTADAHELHRQLGEKLEGQTAIPHEREQEVKAAVAEQLQDFADAGHPDEEELMAEAEARSGA